MTERSNGGGPENSRSEIQGTSSLSTKMSGRLANFRPVPTPLRAIFGYHSTSGDLALDTISIKRHTERFIDTTIDSTFSNVEVAIAAELDIDPTEVEFDYNTKLTMPAELTLGHIYHRAIQNSPDEFNPITRKVSTPIMEYFRFPFDKVAERRRRKKYLEESSAQVEEIELGEQVTELVIIALLDGDMRDATNDKEYEDFEVDAPDRISKQRAAEIAQSTLQSEVEELFEPFAREVRTAYEEAVNISEAHQGRDAYYRELMTEGRDRSDDALENIRQEYKFGTFENVGTKASIIDPQGLFTKSEREFPYLKTQYGRVGVIYDGMIEMYRHAGIHVEDLFKRSIIFAIIGAQIWLDDIDDYQDDLEDGQLTPVTAEYILSDTQSDAYESIYDMTKQYLMTAENYAAKADSPLAGIGTDYIYRMGDPKVLPR